MIEFNQIYNQSCITGMASMDAASVDLCVTSPISRNTIVASINEYDIDQLSSIARFRYLKENCYVFEGFPEQRQILLEKQIVHLASICL